MKTLRDIIIDLPIYGHFSFKLFDTDSPSFPCEISKYAKDQLYELFFCKKIEIKCVECNADYPFTVDHYIKKYKYNNDLFKIPYSPSSYSFRDLDSEELITKNIIPPSEDEGIIVYTYKCTMNPLHYQTMELLYTLDNNVVTIRKIGQKPINTDLRDSYSNEYKNILKKYNAFDDYRKYEQSESRDLLAGACTYLRRILEKMVNIMIGDNSINDEDRNNAKHFEEKLKLVKNQFDPDIQDVIHESYGLLSKGIHELNNDEIDSFYALMAEVINVQLEYEQEKIHRSNKLKELRKNINKNHEDNK